MLNEISFSRTHCIVPAGPVPHSSQTSNALLSISSDIIMEPKLGVCYSERSININVYQCAVNKGALYRQKCSNL